jgi:hypothetical protein
MKFDPSSFPAAAKATGFQSDNLEKILRLRELLTEFQKHSFLGGRLVLKGGTALNLFYLGLTRLSGSETRERPLKSGVPYLWHLWENRCNERASHSDDCRYSRFPLPEA